ncbi:MAG: hypothetical protein IKP62_03445 [Salinivirgaceae bacterium]|nr:hypothetical protein [Salinivirgaceae bacterium]
MSDSRAILCMLILMRLKTELSPFDRLRLHKSALMLNVFSGRDCFNIEDEMQEYYQIVDNLAVEIKQLQKQSNTDTAATLQSQLDNQDSRITEAYKRSIPYVIQSAGFVNSISDSNELVLISAIIGCVHQSNSANINDLETQLKSNNSIPEPFDRKSILSAAINLEKSGVLTKTDAGYCLSGSLKDVSGYERLI